MLQSVEIANFLSHVDTKLVFDKGVTVFVGQNGAGKSSIIDAITFALFGEHIRKSTKGLLKRGSSQAYSKVEFTIGQRTFQAIRKIDSKGTTTARLYEKINLELIPLAAGERKQFGESMTKTIESLIGLDFEKLKVASIVQQGELQSIIESDPKKFKELVNAIIGIDRLDVAFDAMKKTIDDFRISIRDKTGHDDNSIPVLQNRLVTLEKEVSILEPQKNKLENEKTIQEEKIIEIQKRVEKESPKESIIKEIENKKQDLIRYLRNAVISINKEVFEKEKKRAECANSLSIIALKTKIESEMNSAITEVENNRTEIKKTGEMIAMIRGQRDIASKLHLKDGKCPVCNSQVDKLNPLFEEEHLKREIDTLMKNSEILSKQEIATQSKKRELEQKMQQIVKAEGILSLYSIKSESDLQLLTSEISKLQSSVRDIPTEIDIGKLTQFTIDEFSTDMVRSISSMVDETKNFDIKKFQEMKIDLESQRKTLGRIERDITETETKLTLYKKEKTEIASLLDELSYVRKYISVLENIRSQIYNRDGPIATSLRTWALSMISEKASEYLATFNVKIQRITLEDKSRDIGITCYSGNSSLDLESLSGGEKVSVALALRLGMAHMMGTSNLNFIILDEPTTHLDQERRKSLVSVLSQAFESNIDAISQFIIITHDSEIFENSNIDTIYEFKSSPEGTIVTPI